MRIGLTTMTTTRLVSGANMRITLARAAVLFKKVGCTIDTKYIDQSKKNQAS